LIQKNSQLRLIGEKKMVAVFLFRGKKIVIKSVFIGRDQKGQS
jgi:hypothetical protein